MHVTAAVAVSGAVPGVDVGAALEAALDQYGEHDTWGLSAKWEGWTLGGRHVAGLALRTMHGDEERTCAVASVPSWRQPGRFAGRGTAGSEFLARARDIDPNSIAAPISYVDLDGSWHDSRPQQGAGRDWATQLFRWVSALPSDTWLALVDGHR